MIVEELVAKLGVEVDSGSLNKATSFFQTLTTGWAGLATAGAAAVAGLASAAGATGAAADAVGDLAEQLGIGAEGLQKLQFAAKLSGNALDALPQALQIISKNAGLAANGSKEMQKAFEGVSLKDANGQTKTADELLLSVAERMQGLTDPGKQAALAMQVFGRSGGQLLPLLRRGRQGIQELGNEAESLGFVMSDATIKMGGGFADALDKTKAAMQGATFSLGGPLLKAGERVLNNISKLFVKLQPILKAVGEAFSRAFGHWITVLETVFSLLGSVASKIAAAFPPRTGENLKRIFSGLLIALPLLVGYFVALKAAAIASGAAAFAAWMKAALPFILLAAVIGLVVDDLTTYMEGGDSVIGRFIKWLNTINPEDNGLVRFFKTVFKYVFDLDLLVDKVVGTISGLVAAVGKIPYIGRLIGGPGEQTSPVSAAPAPSASDLFSVQSLSPASAGAGTVLAPSNAVNQNNNFVINGATDPKAVAAEVERIQSRQLSEAFSAVKGAK